MQKILAAAALRFPLKKNIIIGFEKGCQIKIDTPFLNILKSQLIIQPWSLLSYLR